MPLGPIVLMIWSTGAGLVVMVLALIASMHFLRTVHLMSWREILGSVLCTAGFWTGPGVLVLPALGLLLIRLGGPNEDESARTALMWVQRVSAGLFVLCLGIAVIFFSLIQGR